MKPICIPHVCPLCSGPLSLKEKWPKQPYLCCENCIHPDGQRGENLDYRFWMYLSKNLDNIETINLMPKDFEMSVYFYDYPLCIAIYSSDGPRVLKHAALNTSLDFTDKDSIQKLIELLLAFT